MASQANKMRESVTLRFVLLVSFLVVYLCIGGAVFSAIEGPIESVRREKLHSSIEDFLSRHECVRYPELDKLMAEIVSESNRGVSVVANRTKPSNWDFASSMFFSATVVTTIGYGTVTPLSGYGKAFCMAYALIGLPLTLLVIGVSVERLSVLTSRLLKFLNSKLSHKCKILTVQLLHLGILGLSVFIFFYLIPAAIFCTLETDWSYFDAIYFCFISLTTIGLGDYTPAHNPEHQKEYRNVYKVAVVGYLILGLISMILLVELMVQIPELNAGLLFMIPKSGMDNNGETAHLTSGNGNSPSSMYTMNTSINQNPEDTEQKPLTQNDSLQYRPHARKLRNRNKQIINMKYI
ncbi:potassium channel subfamily K member 1-like isoform X1 [Ptychodera flava]|uniref:potassium channel subfamily K member 1-like isoform X1 n=1 Tax=Ptychodera flava TaxID=63121 RepID=UPI00396A55C9